MISLFNSHNVSLYTIPYIATNFKSLLGGNNYHLEQVDHQTEDTGLNFKIETLNL